MQGFGGASSIHKATPAIDWEVLHLKWAPVTALVRLSAAPGFVNIVVLQQRLIVILERNMQQVLRIMHRTRV